MPARYGVRRLAAALASAAAMSALTWRRGRPKRAQVPPAERDEPVPFGAVPPGLDKRTGTIEVVMAGQSQDGRPGLCWGAPPGLKMSRCGILKRRIAQSKCHVVAQSSEGRAGSARRIRRLSWTFGGRGRACRQSCSANQRNQCSAACRRLNRATDDTSAQPAARTRTAVSFNEQPSARWTSRQRRRVSGLRMRRQRRNAPRVRAAACQPVGK